MHLRHKFIDALCKSVPPIILYNNKTNPIILKYNAFFFNKKHIFAVMYILVLGTAVAQWLRCCVRNRKVAGSITDGVIGIFH